jgi:hypothetical protein
MLTRKLKALFTAICLSLLASDVTAEEPSSITIFCKETANTGYQWRKGAWKDTGFVENELMVKKISVAEQGALNGQEKFFTEARCGNGWMQDSKDTFYPPNREYAMNIGCYYLYPFGEAPNMLDIVECYETFEAKAKSLQQISCRSERMIFHAAPNGMFQAANVHGDITKKPKNDYKDSIHLSVGKCSVIDS